MRGRETQFIVEALLWGQGLSEKVCVTKPCSMVQSVYLPTTTSAALCPEAVNLSSGDKLPVQGLHRACNLYIQQEIIGEGQIFWIPFFQLPDSQRGEYRVSLE